VEFIARKQDINALEISERTAVGLLAVTNVATGRNMYIYLFDKRVLRTIFGSGWVDKIVYRGTYCYMYCAPNIFRVVKPMSMRCAIHMEHQGQKRNK